MSFNQFLICGSYSYFNYSPFVFIQHCFLFFLFLSLKTEIWVMYVLIIPQLLFAGTLCKLGIKFAKGTIWQVCSFNSRSNNILPFSSPFFLFLFSSSLFRPYLVPLTPALFSIHSFPVYSPCVSFPGKNMPRLERNKCLKRKKKLSVQGYQCSNFVISSSVYVTILYRQTLAFTENQ